MCGSQLPPPFTHAAAAAAPAAAFIDSDEYLVISDGVTPDLPTLLAPYEGYGGLAINWRMFGSSRRCCWRCCCCWGGGPWMVQRQGRVKGRAVPGWGRDRRLMLLTRSTRMPFPSPPP